MERLWAPWRREFVEKGTKVEGCIFCRFPGEEGDEADRRNLVLARSATSFAMVNKFPYTNGHLMVLPRRHAPTLEALPADELADLTTLLQRAVGIVRRAYQPDGLNLGMNLGKPAGAGIADHLHWHIVPRWTGDSNFMPVIGETRVLIESPEQSWERLRPLFSGE